MIEQKYIYQKIPSFLGVPIVKKKQQLQGFDTVILGMPWEGSITWGESTGSYLGTSTIRKASERCSGFLPELDVDILSKLKICDYSDVDVVPGNVLESFKRFESRLKDIFGVGAFPVIIGGDHGISFPAVKALADTTSGKIGVIHFDAHYDNKPEFEGDPYARCCPFQRIAELNNVKTTSLVHIGIRGPRNCPSQAEYDKSIGATTFTSLDVRIRGIDKIVDMAYKIASNGTEKIYVTVCSDALDIAYNPGGPPDPNGLSSFDLSLALYKLGCYGVHGFDIVEFYPRSDYSNTSSHVAAWLIQYLMAGLAQKKV